MKSQTRTLIGIICITLAALFFNIPDGIPIRIPLLNIDRVTQSPTLSVPF